MITIKYILDEINHHKRILILANFIAIVSILLSIPVPLLIPKLIDEVVLGKEGYITDIIDQYLSIGSPEYYILVVLVITILLRAISLLLNIIHIRLFTKIAKDVSYKGKGKKGEREKRMKKNKEEKEEGEKARKRRRKKIKKKK